MTFDSLLLDCYRRLRLPAAPPAATIVRIKALANEVHREIVTSPGIERLREDVMPITAVGNIARMGFPPIVSRIRKLTDRTNGVNILQVPLADLRNIDPMQTNSSGFPTRYAVIGYRPVQFQPATAAGLWAVSSATADVTGPTVFVQTRTTGGYAYADSEVLTGTTRVAVGTGTPRTDHEEVTRFYVGGSSAAAGYVSLYNAASSGVELARLEPGQTSQHYLTVEWSPVPTENVTLYLDYVRNIFDLVQPFDEPLIPIDFHPVIALGVRLKEYELLDDDRAIGARQEYVKGVAALKSYILNDGEAMASRRPRGGWRFSMLGSKYPSGS